jgi:hypothetical protein
MIPDLDAAAAAIVAQLAAGGVRATVDERDLNPPCVWVGPPTLAWRFGRATWDAGWTLTAVVADTGRGYSNNALAALVVQTQDALGWAATQARPVSLIVPGTGGTPMPGYEMTFTQRIRETAP